MRAGTTMLHDLLSGHPQISMARMKETDFFVAEKNLPRGTGWYGAQFDPARPIRGEISPNYAKAMDFPGVPERIFEHCPGVRLVYVLRDPVARAVSQYAHSWNMGELSDTPEQMARVQKAVAEPLKDPAVKQRMDAQGLFVSGTSSADFTKQIASEVAKMKGVAAAAGISID